MYLEYIHTTDRTKGCTMSYEFGFTVCIQPKADRQGKKNVTVYWWPLQCDNDLLLNYYRKRPHVHPVEPIPTRETGPLLVKRGRCTAKRLEEFKIPDYWINRKLVTGPSVTVKTQLVNSEVLPCKTCAIKYFRNIESREKNPLVFHLLLDRLNSVECRHRLSKSVAK